MEVTQDHSKAKLMLAIITSPGAAFEEILRRRLLSTGLWIAFAAGCFAMVGAALRAYPSGPVHFLSIGYANPFTWIGLLFLYAAAVHGLLKWLGTDNEFADILLILSWAQVTLLAAQVLSVAEAAVVVSNGSAAKSPVIALLGPLTTILRVAYALVAAVGIRCATGAVLARGVMSYLVVHFAAVVGLTFTYAKSRMGLFQDAPMGIAYASQALIIDEKPPWINDCTPLLGAAVVGIALGTWLLGRSLEWDERTRKTRTAAAALIGLAVFGVYYNTLSTTDYYGKLLAPLRLYERDKFADAADKLEKVVPLMPGEAVPLILDVGNFRFAAGQDQKAEAAFAESIKAIKGKNPAEKKLFESFARVGLGAVYDIQGKLPQAAAEFNLARKLWPEFKEPWIRAAVTLARAGNAKEAVEIGSHAAEKLKSRAPQLYAALAQAYAMMGDDDKARAAYKRLHDLDRKLAESIGKTPGQWKSAVDKLDRQRMRFPLERDFVYSPPRARPGARVPSKTSGGKDTRDRDGEPRKQAPAGQLEKKQGG